MRHKKLAVVGSRFISLFAINQVLVNLFKAFAELEYPPIIVSGNGGNVDIQAKKLAERYDLPTLIFPARWKRGKDQGFIRNTYIAEHCDVGFALWDGSSNGTQDTVTKIRKLGKPAIVCSVYDSDVPYKNFRQEVYDALQVTCSENFV